MWSWLHDMFADKTAPAVSLNGKPLTVNPSLSAKAQRNQDRIARLKQAIASGDKRKELKIELARREKEGR